MKCAICEGTRNPNDGVLCAPCRKSWAPIEARALKSAGLWTAMKWAARRARAAVKRKERGNG